MAKVAKWESNPEASDTMWAFEDAKDKLMEYAKNLTGMEFAEAIDPFSYAVKSVAEAIKDVDAFLTDVETNKEAQPNG